MLSKTQLRQPKCCQERTAGANNTTGSNNIYVGASAVLGTTNSNNVVIGQRTLESNTANDNTAIGQAALVHKWHPNAATGKESQV